MIFQADVSSKKRMYKFNFTNMRLVFVRFWKKLKTQKRHFEINWPLYFIKNIYIILFSLSYKNGYQKSYSGKENANVKCQHRSKKKRKFIFEDNIHVWLNTVTKVLMDNSSFLLDFSSLMKSYGVLIRRSWIADVTHGPKSADGALTQTSRVSCCGQLAWSQSEPDRLWTWMSINNSIKLKPFRGPAFAFKLFADSLARI